jgi:exosortase J
MRGAITLGYGALIVGYLKRVPILKWGVYVIGAVALGHLFNLLRLCALVLYYKVAIGDPELERAAKQADYVIGAVLFLVAAFLFLWVVLRTEKASRRAASNEDARDRSQIVNRAPIYWKTGAFCLLVLMIIAPGVRAARKNPDSVTLQIQRGSVAVTELSGRLPVQVGAYKRVRVWQEDIAGVPVLETAAFDAAPSDEITMGIWLGPSDHSIRDSLMTHGDTPRLNRRDEYAAAGNQVVPFNTALYDDGITVTLIGDTHCSPSVCDASPRGAEGLHLILTRPIEHSSRRELMVPVFFKIQAPHSDAPMSATYAQLSAKSRAFLSNVDFRRLSQNFQ